MAAVTLRAACVLSLFATVLVANACDGDDNTGSEQGAVDAGGNDATDAIADATSSASDGGSDSTVIPDVVTDTDAADTGHESGSVDACTPPSASTSWTLETITSASGCYVRSVASANDKVHVLYGCGTFSAPNVYYATNATGTWTIEAVPLMPSQGPSRPPTVGSLAVDASGDVHVCQIGSDASYDPIGRHAKRSGGAWTHTEIAWQATPGSSPVACELALDNTGEPRIVFVTTSGSNKDLWFAAPGDAGWTVLKAGGLGETANADLGLWLDGPHAHIVGISHFEVPYATNESGVWTSTSIEKATEGVEAVGAAKVGNDLHAVYRAYLPSDPSWHYPDPASGLGYFLVDAVKDGGAWERRYLSCDPGDQLASELRVASAATLRFLTLEQQAEYDGGAFGGRLYFNTLSDAGRTRDLVSASLYYQTPARAAGIALGTADKGHIVFIDEAGMLRHAQQTP